MSGTSGTSNISTGLQESGEATHNLVSTGFNLLGGIVKLVIFV